MSGFMRRPVPLMSRRGTGNRDARRLERGVTMVATVAMATVEVLFALALLAVALVMVEVEGAVTAQPDFLFTFNSSTLYDFNGRDVPGFANAGSSPGAAVHVVSPENFDLERMSASLLEDVLRGTVPVAKEPTAPEADSPQAGSTSEALAIGSAWPAVPAFWRGKSRVYMFVAPSASEQTARPVMSGASSLSLWIYVPSCYTPKGFLPRDQVGSKEQFDIAVRFSRPVELVRNDVASTGISFGIKRCPRPFAPQDLCSGPDRLVVSVRDLSVSV